MGKETYIKSKYQSLVSSGSTEMFLQARDIYYAAAIMKSQNITIGQSDTRQIFSGMIYNSMIPAIKDKL
jgi:hypothetical protein